ncbi:hypothetical protein T265_12102 [Opisthorchis viverrini]|uniref:Uncharacterized protein n=1 Tax=Opisthorchis viverrini TaxID=6198 RepID=A0A074Z6N8_OPIVI|nr:hypothetical protein T265_12102 [Opisthorchis viverrini]KER18910.1 hypothetical protein T265_12102 [Opisthorchis viverrini]
MTQSAGAGNSHYRSTDFYRGNNKFLTHTYQDQIKRQRGMKSHVLGLAIARAPTVKLHKGRSSGVVNVSSECFRMGNGVLFGKPNFDRLAFATAKKKDECLGGNILLAEFNPTSFRLRTSGVAEATEAGYAGEDIVLNVRATVTEDWTLPWCDGLRTSSTH